MPLAPLSSGLTPWEEEELRSWSATPCRVRAGCAQRSWVRDDQDEWPDVAVWVKEQQERLAAVLDDISSQYTDRSAASATDTWDRATVTHA